MSRKRLYVEYRLAGPIARNPWRPLGYFNDGRVTVPRISNGPIYIRARIENAGRLGPTKETYFDYYADAADVPNAVAEKPAVAVKLRSDGTIAVSTTAPKGSGASRFVTEVRVSEKAAGQTQAVELGTVDPGSEVLHNGIASSETDVMTRAVEKTTDITEPWVTETIASNPTPDVSVDLEDNAGTDLTGLTVIDRHGEPTVEAEPLPADGVRLKDMRRLGASGWPLRLGAMTSDTGPRFGAMGNFWPEGIFEIESGDTGALHDFLPVVDIESHPPEILSRRLGALRQGFRWNERVERADGSIGRERGRYARLGDRDYDQSGIQLVEEISTSDSAALPDPAQLRPIVHGRVYRARRVLRRFRMETRFGWRRFRVKKFRTVRRVKNRKHEPTVTGAITYPTTPGVIEVRYADFGIDEFQTTPTVTMSISAAVLGNRTTAYYQLVANSPQGFDFIPLLDQRLTDATVAGAYAWTYPVPFINPPELFLTVDDSTQDAVIQAAGITATAADIETRRLQGQLVTANFFGLATGVPAAGTDLTFALLITGV